MLNEMSGYTDDQLVSLVGNGNADAFVELTGRYLSLIRAKAAPFRSSMLETDDLCQEGLLGLFSAARSYQSGGKASFRTYAGVCITNRIITAYRTAAGHKNFPLNNSLSLNDNPDLDLDVRLPLDLVANPETLLIDRENLEIVKKHIKQTLSKMEQQVLFLYLSGYSYAEISANLHITVKAADNAIQRVRRKLAEPF